MDAAGVYEAAFGHHTAIIHELTGKVNPNGGSWQQNQSYREEVTPDEVGEECAYG